MSTLLPLYLRRTLSAFLATTALFSPSLVNRAHAVIDNNATEQIWKLKYGVTQTQLEDTVWLNQDTDGDGIKNSAEIASGTNPFNASKTVKVSTVARNTGNGTVELTFSTEPGKFYQIQSTSTLGGAWALEAQSLVGDGTTKMLIAPYVDNKFYRVRVTDTDTDDDGVSDWAERAASLNPSAAQTVPGVNDHDYVNEQIALPNIVSIKATTPFASEDGPTAGMFNVTRTQSLLPITVTYSVGGTATAGVDYDAEDLTGSVALPAGTSSANIPVNPLVEQAAVEGSESVTATLTAAPPSEPPYTLGTPGAATVIINDSTFPAGTGLLARYYDTASSTYAHAANFGQDGTYIYTRTGTGSPNTGTILVPYTGTPAVAVGNVVKLTFTAGNLNSATYNNLNYTISAVTPGVNFTAAITGTSLPASDATARTCNFSIQSFPHPPVIERIDPVVNNDWVYGTPHDVTVIPNSPVDNYSTVFEGYLHPTTAGNYQFQLDADDKARVLLDMDADGPGGMVEILEHGWDGGVTPETIGTFKVSASIPLGIPGTPAQRYKIRVEHVETTGDARCRLQWREGANGFVNIPSTNVFSHTRALTNYTATGTVATINTAVAHNLSVGNSVTLYFSSGTLFTPPANYSGTYTVASVVDTDTFTVNIAGASPQTSGAAGFMADSTSTTAGWLNQIYTNTAFTGPPGYVNVVGGGATNSNNGIWGSGTPDPIIGKDTFSIRWTGQVQPQFSEEYTFVVHADDGSSLWINGQLQEMETAPSTSTGVGTYDYSNATGDAIINYTTSVVKPGSYIVGEIVRVDPTGGNLTHGNGSTYTYDGVTGVLTVNYSNLANIIPGGFAVGETIELDPTLGTLSSLSTLPYVITSEPSSSTFTVYIAPGLFDSELPVSVPGASTVAGSATVTVPSTAGLVVGMAVSGTGIPANEFITAIGTGQITITTGTGVTAQADTTLTCRSTINILDTRNAVITKLFATGATYSYNSTTGDAVVTYSGVTGVAPSSFLVGATVELDPTSGNLSPLTSTGGYVITAANATTFTVNFGTGTYATGTGNINIASPANGVIPAAITNAFAINFGTSKYNTGTGNINVEIVNKPLKEWSAMGNERYVRIPMVGGTRYDIQLDFWENGGYSRCALYWYSPSQPKQIIPADRLYPSSAPQAPAAHVSPTVATTLVNGPFSHQVAGSNGSVVSVSGLPPGLTYSGGVISGTATAAGDYQIVITVTNTAGTSTSVLNLHVDEAAGSIVRELWTPVGGTSVASIPTGTTATSTSNLTSLAGPSGVGPDYGARMRGYITAPVTGNYYFWIAANHGAELWISNDDEPVNAIKRAWVLAGNAAPQTWNGEPNQKSPWLALEAGKRYYIEVLHKAGGGTGDNLAVGWLKPGESGTVPSQVVPGYVLSPYVAPAPGSTPGTLYVATMLAQAGAVTNGVGVATFRLSEDENVATVNFDIPGFLTPPYNGLTGIMTDWHVHNDPYLAHPSSIMYDPTAPPANSGLQPDGSHKWTIPAMVGTKTKADVIELIKQGKAYINIHTTAYLNGEIRGNFTLANGSRTFTPPPAPPAWTDDHTTNAGAARFLTQATFGPSTADIAALKALPSYEAWIDAQLALSVNPNDTLLKEVIRTENASAQGGAFNNNLTFNAWWLRSITAAEQLRHRVAFALSEIHVVSAQGPLDNNALATSYFYDKLVANAFGNFRDILEDTTLTPSMGRYLDMLNNDKPDQTVGRIPNENYAREIKQLFSVGLYRMWPDGTLILNSKDQPIDVYSQREIVGFAHVFTGWGYGYDGALRTSFSAPTSWVRQMREVPARHFTGPKRVLNNEVLPGLAALGTQPLDPNAVHTSNNYNDPDYQALPGKELDATHDQLFNHPNTGPFICRQLIQRLVTSAPSRDYIYRVVQKFNDNGSGVRGDMKAVIKAILLDYEARSGSEATKPTFGKQREPVMRVAAAARAFRTNSWSGTYLQESSPALPKTAQTITVTVTSGTHGLENGDTVFLEFTGAVGPTPWIGTYSVSNVTATTFTVNAAGWSFGTYSIPANSTVCTVTMNGHWLEAANQAYFDFTTVTAGGALPADGIYTAATSTSTNTAGGSTFTIAVASSGAARTGNLWIPRFTPGSFTTSASGLAAPNDRRVTMDTNTNHELVTGNQVQLNFYAGSNPQPLDRVATFESNLDLNTWTFLAPGAGTNLSPNQGNNSVFQFPLQPLPTDRSGTVGNRPSTFQVNSTTAELEQTPINSPTVFNFFLPDYKFPGTLQSQGMSTPEFQITAETTVVRQSNYLYNGIFGSNNVNGINSFNNGNHALVMDFSPWYGVATGASGPGQVLGAGPQTGQAWTSNANLSTLIDRLNTLLVGENMPTTAKNIVLKFLDLRAITAIATGNPCTITSAGHNLNTGDVVVISGVTGGTFSPSINGTYTITKTGADTFTVPSNCTSITGLNLTAAVAPIVPYNNTTPSDTNKRDRLRAIIHFILTSPDYTIQR